MGWRMAFLPVDAALTPRFLAPSRGLPGDNGSDLRTQKPSTLVLLIPIGLGVMHRSTRDLLASVLGEAPAGEPAQQQPAALLPALKSQPTAFLKLQQQPMDGPGLWRVTGKLSGGLVQISNNRESRVVRNDQIELYLRGHGPALAPPRP